MITSGTPPEATTYGNRLRQALTDLLLWLIEPPARLPEPMRHRARLLSGLLLALLLLIVAGISAFSVSLASYNPLPGLTFPITFFGTVLLATAYALNRRGHYPQAASLTIAVTALGVWAVVIAYGGGFATSPFLLLYVLLSVLLSSLLLSPRATAYLAAIHLLAIVMAPIVISGFGPIIIINSFLFVSFTSLVTVVGASLRQRDQAQLLRQTRVLAESEQRFRALFAASPDAIMLLDPHDPRVDWLIVDCNEAAWRLNGFSREELVGQSIDILNATPSGAQERMDFETRLRREQKLHLERIRRRKDRSLYPVEVSTSLITLAGHELLLGIDRDITERKQAEQRMHAISDILRTLNAATDVAAAFLMIESQVKTLTSCEHIILALTDERQEWFTLTGLDQSQVMRGGKGRYHLSDFAAAADMLAGRPYKTTDLAAETSLPVARSLYEAGYRSCLILPLRHGGQVLGLLISTWRQPAGYDAARSPLLDQIAEAFGLAIARSRAFQTERRLRARAQALQKLSSLVALSLDLSQVLNTLAQQVLEVMEVPVCNLLLWEPPDDLAWRSGLGLGEDVTIAVRRKVGQGLAGWVAAQRQPLIVDEMLADERTTYHDMADQSRLHAYLGVPLEAKGYLVGTLDICTHEPRHFDDEDAALLTAIAIQAALAIENARLYDETQRRAQESETLRQAGAVVTSTLSQSDALEHILEQLARVVPHDSASVQLLRIGPPDYLELVGGRGWPDPAAVRGLHIPVPADNPNSAVIQTRQIVNLGNAPAEHAGLWEGPHSYIKSWLGVPLIVFDRIIGMLTLDSATVNAFNTSQVRMAGAFADQVAIALEHARLFAETQSRAVELQAVNHELTNGIAERLRAEQALESANQQLLTGIRDLQQRTRDMTLLNEMSDLLQACLNVDEAYGVVTRLGLQLFPGEAGRLYILSPSRDLVESVAAWGEPLLDPSTFAPDDCWGLRRGRLHLVESQAIGTDTSEGKPALVCRHVPRPWPFSSVCVPLTAQGEALGFLYLCQLPQAWPGRASEPPLHLFGEGKLQLIQTVADSLALALANLRLRETLRHQSIRDPLTGLFNRRYLEETLEREVQRASRHQGLVGIIMLDLDHFKDFNDTFGHEAGDTVLRELGIVLRSQFRGEDIACRYGGEEFTLILPEASLTATQQRAEYVREQVKHMSIQHRGQSLGIITVSLGVAVYPVHGATGESVLREADTALYEAKREGRDRVAIAASREAPTSAS